MVKNEKHTVKVRTVFMSCFEGEKVPNGTEISREAFKVARSARLHMYGPIEDGTEVDVLLTAGQNGVAEFRKMVDIIEREGTFECFGHLVHNEVIGGEPIAYDPPRLRVELSDDKGQAQFKYTPKASPEWAKEYGEYKALCIDFGKDPEQAKGFADRRKAARQSRRDELKKKMGI